MMSKTDVTEAVLSLEVIHGGAKFIDANHNLLWHIPINSNFKGLLSVTAPSKWVGKLSKDRVIMRSHSGGSLPNKRQKIFALDASEGSIKFFFFQS